MPSPASSLPAKSPRASYVGRRRTVMQQQPLSPAHQAVAEHDLARLRDLLDAGHDIEDDSGDGWTLLRRAIHAEAARLPGAGDPLHADMITFLLVRGANPQAPGKPAEAEAELLGHWLAAEIIRAWTQRPRWLGSPRSITGGNGRPVRPWLR